MFSIFFSSINPITGVVEEEQPNPMEGMTEEQKEYEAMKLVDMFDKLSRSVKSRRRKCTHIHMHTLTLVARWSVSMYPKSILLAIYFISKSLFKSLFIQA